MTIEEAIEHMMHVWEQLKEKAIKLGVKKKRRYHRKEKPSVFYHYIPTARRNLPYMRRSY